MAYPQTLMKEAELREWILRRLGSPVLKVDLSCQHLDDAVAEAKRWFAAKKGIEREVVIDVFSGVVEYDVPEDCDAVLDVSFSGNKFDISAMFAPYWFVDNRVPYGVFASTRSAGLYSSYVQAMQYTEMAKRVMSADLNWMYYPSKRKLMLWPATKYDDKAIVEYKSSVSNLELLTERDHDLIKRFSLAWAKRDLGHIYSKYSSMPAAQGQVTLNGPQLLQEAEAEFQKLEDEIAGSAMPMAFVVG